MTRKAQLQRERRDVLGVWQLDQRTTQAQASLITRDRETFVAAEQVREICGRNAELRGDAGERARHASGADQLLGGADQFGGLGSVDRWLDAGRFHDARQQFDDRLLDVQVIRALARTQIPQSRSLALQFRCRTADSRFTCELAESGSHSVAQHRIHSIDVRRDQHVVKRLIIDEPVAAHVARRDEQRMVRGEQRM